MHFIKGNAQLRAINHLVQLIDEATGSGKRVLLLVSGGSTIEIAVQVRRKLARTSGLTVMQVDERFGPVGHSDSNWQQLIKAGFDRTNLKWQPILRNKDINKTSTEYRHDLAGAISGSDLVVGLFGIGADGHTAGILPGSQAVHEQNLVSAYIAPDYERITITPAAIAKINLAIVYATGYEKATALQNLQKDLPVEAQPAQALKLAGDTYVYNDYLEANT